MRTCGWWYWWVILNQILVFRIVPSWKIGGRSGIMLPELPMTIILYKMFVNQKSLSWAIFEMIHYIIPLRHKWRDILPSRKTFGSRAKTNSEYLAWIWLIWLIHDLKMGLFRFRRATKIKPSHKGRWFYFCGHNGQIWIYRPLASLSWSRFRSY